MKQQTLSGFEKYGKTTRRAQLLSNMDRIIPWAESSAAVEKVYPKGGDAGGRPAAGSMSVSKPRTAPSRGSARRSSTRSG